MVKICTIKYVYKYVTKLDNIYLINIFITKPMQNLIHLPYFTVLKVKIICHQWKTQAVKSQF